MIEFLKKMGALRVMLQGLAFLFMLILPFSEPSWNPQGVSLLLDAAVPAFAPIIAIIMMLDVMMCKISQSDSQDPAEKIVYRNIVRAHLVTAAILIFFWINAISDVLF